MKKLLWTLAVAALTWASAAHADDCKPDFGDKALRWVIDDAGRQSRDLVRADYQGRTFNYRLVGYERLHLRIVQIEQALGGVASRIAALDQSQRDDIALAIEREQNSEHLLTTLYEIAAWLDSVEQANGYLQAPTDLSTFRREGYGSVGRETLMSSMSELGDSSANSLGGRYGIYIQVSFDGNGNPQSGHAESTPGGALSAVGIALIRTGEPYAIAAGAILLLADGILNEACRDRWDEQRAKVREAAGLLPSKLITEAEQWAAFQPAEENAIQAFAEIGLETHQAIDALRSRWKTLFAANAARAAVAEAVLTEAKIERIRADLEAGLDPGEIREQVAIAEVASGIGQINAALAQGRVSVLTSCLNTAGVAIEEDQSDAINFSRAQFKAFRAQAGFALLHTLLDESDRIAKLAGDEIAAQGPTATQRLCGTKRADSTVGRSFAGIVLPHDWPGKLDASVNVELDAGSLAMIVTGSIPSLYCELVREGSGYTCAPPGGTGPGNSFGSDFNNSGDPRRDISAGANDAGFANDSRRLSADVDQASANIEQRIRDTDRRVGEARAALPAWTATNTAALQQTAEQTMQGQAADLVAEAAFEAVSEPLVASVKKKIDDFVNGAADATSVSDLVQAVGGADLSLAGLPQTELVPSIPEIVGVSGLEAAYGPETSLVQRQAMREERKADVELAGDPKALELSRALVLEAQRTSLAPGGEPIAKELILDASSLRFAADGRLSGAEISVVQKDGKIIRQPITDPANLPENALVTVTQNFHRDQEFYRMAATTLRNSLASGAPFAGRRGEVLDVADDLFARAQTSFSNRNLPEARAWMAMAIGVVDIATRFIPGVDWGRDVYEVVTGRDLFTGEQLSKFDRVSALIGVVTAGVGNNGLAIVKAFEKIPEIPTSKWDEIYEFTQTVDGQTLDALETTAHAVKQMDARAITRDDIRKVLDDHTPLWHREDNTFFAVGNEFHPSGRIGVAVNIEERKITTVMDVPKTDAALLAERISEGRHTGELRYEAIRLDDE